MSARKVADLLSLAREGIVRAEASGDAALGRDARRLMHRALTHPSAGTFFGALALAMDEIDDRFGNDPVVQDNGGGALEPEGDGESTGDAAAPAYEGLTHPEGEDDQSVKPQDDGSESDDGKSRVTAAVHNLGRILKAKLQWSTPKSRVVPSILTR